MTRPAVHCSDGERTAVVSGSGRTSYADLVADRFGLRATAVVTPAVAICSDDAALVAGALVALEGVASEVHLLPAELPLDRLPDGVELVTPGEAADDGLVASVPSTVTVERPTRWVVYTSGTTGEPKAIRHTHDSLTRTVVPSPSTQPYTWGLLYDPTRMAGLQVLHQALATCATVVAPGHDLTFGERIAVLVDGGVDALSATPTLWRMILQTPAARDWPLRQITLGGEIADQSVLSTLDQRYPRARLRHVFASTETGAAFSVGDGRAGFPLTYLTEAPRGVRLEVRDGILHVHSPGVSEAGADGFASTGDIVEIVDDRVIFKGRASGVVNVGGANVWPEEVERLLRTHPDVADAAVTAKASSFSGNILVARVVLQPDADREGVTKRLRSWMRQHATGPQVPATITAVDELTLSAAGKAQR